MKEVVSKNLECGPLNYDPPLLAEQLKGNGFFRIESSSLSPISMFQVFHECYNFFSLPEVEKLKYFFGKDIVHGFYPNGREFQERYSDETDDKECWMGSRIDPCWADAWPDRSVPNFRLMAQEFFKVLNQVSVELFTSICPSLEMPKHDSDFFRADLSGLRFLHYPASPQPRSRFRSYPHEDMTLLTLLLPTSTQGLQILTPQKNWVDLDQSSDEIVVIAGQMLQRMSNNRVRATTHRVVRRDEARLSVAFFLIPGFDTVIKCFNKPEEYAQYEPILTEVLLRQNLEAINLVSRLD